jgi:hypothetical protein
LDIGLLDIVPLSGDGTLGAGLGGRIGFGSDLGPFPGDNMGGELSMLLPDGAEGLTGEPPLQFLELNTPSESSTLAPLGVTGLELNDFGQPQHMPEPSSMILAVLGGGCAIFSRLSRRSRRHGELP